MVQGVANLYTGKYTHTLDTKNRLTIPSKWRPKSQRGERDIHFLLMPIPDGYVAALPENMIEKLYEKVSESGLGNSEGQMAIRKIFGNSETVVCDSQGRVGLTPGLLEHTGLKNESDVLLVGTLARFEIWEPGRHDKKMSGVEISSDEAIKKALRDLGI